MIKLIVDKLPRITKARKRLEEKLKVKINNRGREVSISGKPEDEFIAGEVINALDLGFDFSIAISIKDEGYVLEILNIKKYTKRHDLKTIRARIIGKWGKTINNLSLLTKCEFELKNNEVGIIGDPEHVKNAHAAVIHLIKGAKQSNVYSYLEKHQIKPILDLGLKKK